MGPAAGADAGPLIFYCTAEEFETRGKSGKEKDIAEKTLEAYNDVFGDIVNGLLFMGRQVIREEALTDAQPFSMYKMDDGLHEQDRDVAKFWNEASTERVNVRIAFLGIENQTDYDKDMPMRVIGYDGAAYRINVFEIAFLTPEQVKCFHSDFRVVADYFSGKRRDPDYRPTDPVKFKHVDELLNLMAAITRDNRFEDWLQEGEEKTRDMDAFLDRVEEKGRQEGFLEALAGLVKKGPLSLTDAAKEANLTPAEFQAKIAALHKE